MTRLFLRFYIGVLVILVAAWLIQVFVNNPERFAKQNAQVVRDALFGGIRLAVKKVEAAPIADRQRILKEIDSDFDYPVRLFPDAWQGETDESIYLVEGRIIARIEGRHALVFGPLPRLASAGQREQLTGWGVVLILAALAIALLLRPVVRQFQQIETAATKIAAGDLATRIDVRHNRAATGLTSAFNNMAARTEAIVNSQRELLQSVSHELRTPLARIHFAVDLIRSGDQQQREERMDSLESAADDLDSLVGELLTYARIESQPHLESTEFSVCESLELLFQKQQTLFPNIVFATTDDFNQSRAAIAADRQRFERALSNLLSNAARHATERVIVSGSLQDDLVIINVEDDGPGIDSADRSRVLEPFVRLDTTDDGVGLGLPIVRRIVEKHGGTVSIHESSLNGCRVRTTWTKANPE